jgi:16S rRNA (guanine(966)-N(2))-methyltransferase RsmD
LFNIIGPEVSGSVFLDLFAGTGSVGIEALSRGAARAVFVERDARAAKVVEENLMVTGLRQAAEVVHEDAFRYLARMREPAFDFVYVAPPQYQGLWEKAVLDLDRSPFPLRADAAVIAQIDPQEFLALELRSLVEYDRRKYGSTLLVFYEYGVAGDEDKSVA